MKTRVYNVIHENYVDTPDGCAEIIVNTFRSRKAAEGTLTLLRDEAVAFHRLNGRSPTKEFLGKLRDMRALEDEDGSFWGLYGTKNKLLERATLCVNDVI